MVTSRCYIIFCPAPQQTGPTAKVHFYFDSLSSASSPPLPHFNIPLFFRRRLLFFFDSILLCIGAGPWRDTKLSNLLRRLKSPVDGRNPPYSLEYPTLFLMAADSSLLAPAFVGGDYFLLLFMSWREIFATSEGDRGGLVGEQQIQRSSWAQRDSVPKRHLHLCLALYMKQSWLPTLDE